MRPQLNIVNFAPEHFRRMRLRREDAADIAGIDASQLMHYWRNGRTLLYGDVPAMLFGYEENQGTIVLWAVTSPLVRSLPLFITRLARSFIGDVLRGGAHRVEVYCHVDNARSLRWLTRGLGFHLEGLVRRCGPNRQDRFLLSLTDYDIASHGLYSVKH
jgi:hypothetical protein